MSIHKHLAKSKFRLLLEESGFPRHVAKYREFVGYLGQAYTDMTGKNQGGLADQATWNDIELKTAKMILEDAIQATEKFFTRTPKASFRHETENAFDPERRRQWVDTKTRLEHVYADKDFSYLGSVFDVLEVAVWTAIDHELFYIYDWAYDQFLGLKIGTVSYGTREQFIWDLTIQTLDYLIEEFGKDPEQDHEAKDSLNATLGVYETVLRRSLGTQEWHAARECLIRFWLEKREILEGVDTRYFTHPGKPVSELDYALISMGNIINQLEFTEPKQVVQACATFFYLAQLLEKSEIKIFEGF